MDLRLSADWMVMADDRILEYLFQEGPHSPKPMADDDRLRLDRKHINMRLLKLHDYGLVDRADIGRGVYEIARPGEAYLAGELDAADLDPSDV